MISQLCWRKIIPERLLTGLLFDIKRELDVGLQAFELPNGKCILKGNIFRSKREKNTTLCNTIGMSLEV